MHSKRNTHKKIRPTCGPTNFKSSHVRYLTRDFSTLNNLNMFVFANICDCALWKTVYDRSIERAIDARSIETCLCYAWHGWLFRQIQTCLSHLCQTNNARSMLCNCTVA